MFSLVAAVPLLAFAAAGSSAQATTGMVASAWYSGSHAEDFSPGDVSWDKYTHLTYSFAETSSDVNNLSLADSDASLLPKFVSTAHENGVQALVSVGGWTGSSFFSSNVANASNRAAFVKTLTSLATTYKLDGIEFDWEYPGSQGIGCNSVSPNDTSNFLALLQELRQDPAGANLTLTAATSLLPWNGPDGNPLTNVSAFAKVLDWIEIMNYDVWGSWSATVGPNSPLNDTCAPSADQQGSAVSAVKTWTGAGMPSHQIVLGVAAYGHSFFVTGDDALECDNDTTSLVPYPSFNQSKQPSGDMWDSPAGKDVCGNATSVGGTFDFWGLIDAGFLLPNGSAAPGIDYRFDDCSKTAYVYNETSSVEVSFDDAPAFAAKGDYIKSNNLRGFSIWQAGGDSNDILLDSIRAAAGLPLTEC